MGWRHWAAVGEGGAGKRPLGARPAAKSGEGGNGRRDEQRADASRENRDNKYYGILETRRGDDNGHNLPQRRQDD